MQLTKEQVIEKYSSGFLKLLDENRWVNSFRKTKHEWDEEIGEIWIPSFSYLWRLCEVYIPANTEKRKDRIEIRNTNEGYNVTYDDYELYGDCPEEALLKLFIKLEVSGK